MIKTIRNNYNLSRKDLSKILGVSVQTILNWENEIYFPKYNHLLLIKLYFGVNLIELKASKENKLEIIKKQSEFKDSQYIIKMIKNLEN